MAQAAAAKEQIRLAEFQFREEQKHFEAQQRIDLLKEMAEYQRLLAEDDATRPRFAISSSYSRTNGASVEIKNVGGGDAINLVIVSPVVRTAQVKQPIVRAGNIFRCSLDLVEMEVQPATCTFTSRLGSRWEVQFRFNGALVESIVSVHRPYDLQRHISGESSGSTGES